jgi:tetratricopeptide (TPR) repeat protein
MPRTRHPNAGILFALLIAMWLAAAPAAPAAGIQPVSRSTVTLTLSGHRPELGRERGPSDATHSHKAKRLWDAPSCRLEEQLFADVSHGRLEKFSPLGAALVASGVDDVDCLHRYQQKAAALADELRRLGKPTDTPRQRVEAIFEFMHQRILGGGYDLAYTDLRRVLDDGRFNCVSATVLFNYLANELGLDCSGLEMPGHAMSRVSLPDGTLDVETTCPRWFSLKDDPKRQFASVVQTIGAAASADRSKAREVSAIQLAAMIYYNRGVDLLGEKRFAEAAGVNAKALRLDPQNATARGNLLATLNNWSIELGNRGHFAEAVDLLRQGLAMDAKFEAFAQNYVHVHHQWVEYLSREGRFGEAVEILSRAAAEMPDRDYLRKAQSEVRQRWAKAVAAAPAK